MSTEGTYNLVSTRNNDFSNRSHKSRIHIFSRRLVWWHWLLIAISIIIFLTLMMWCCLQCYIVRHPGSKVSAKRYRSEGMMRCCI